MTAREKSASFDSIMAKRKNASQAKVKVLFVTSEHAPFAKLGGLGEVMFSLPRALKDIGHDARVIIPRYGTIDPVKYDLKIEQRGLLVPTGYAGDDKPKELICNVLRYDATNDPKSPVTTYFLENQEYYEFRSNAYGYGDDHIRFALLSRGTMEFLKNSGGWVPDVIVCTDWVSALLPSIMKFEYQAIPNFSHIATVLSVHNLAYQGTAKHHKFTPEMERDDGYGPLPDFFDERMKKINPLRRGIMYADVINTVSPKYAEEITTEEFGEGLEKLFQERHDRLWGILNGIDYTTNNPATDPSLAKNFTVATLQDRSENKLALQQRFGLPQNKDVFLMSIASRLAKQKGFGLVKEVIEPFLRDTRSQLIIVGSGDTELMLYFQELEKKYLDQVRADLHFTQSPHLIFAGTDVVLLPSKYEPSGLVQMEAMRYGAIPGARRVGGLADTVEDYSPVTKKGGGFLFSEFDAISFLIALTRAWVNWRHRFSWKKLQTTAMSKDFSWEHSAESYAKLFRRAIELRKKDREKEAPPERAKEAGAKKTKQVTKSGGL